MFTNDLAEPQFGRAKKIKIWNNGDEYGTCHEFTINPNRFRTWNSILSHVTNVIQPNNGAVRRLISLTTKKSIYCFRELDPNDRYVAVGQKNLVIPENGYKTRSERDLLKKRKLAQRHYSGDFFPPKFRFLQITKKRGLTIIYVVVNKITCQTPSKVVLNEKDFDHWDVVLEFLANMLDIPSGIQGLYTIFGTLIEDPLSLQHGYVYVALPCGEKFVLIDYMQLFDNLMKPMASYTVAIRPASKFGKKKSKLESASKISSRYKYDGYSSQSKLEANTFPSVIKTNRSNMMDNDATSYIIRSTSLKSRTSSSKSEPGTLPNNRSSKHMNNRSSKHMRNPPPSPENVVEAISDTRRFTAKRSKTSKVTVPSMPQILEETSSKVSLTDKDSPKSNRSRTNTGGSAGARTRSNILGEEERKLPSNSKDVTDNTKQSSADVNVTETRINDNEEMKNNAKEEQSSGCPVNPSIEVSVKSSITLNSCQTDKPLNRSSEWKCQLTPCSHKECTCQTDTKQVKGSETQCYGILEVKSQKTTNQETETQRVSYGFVEHNLPSLGDEVNNAGSTVVRNIDMDRDLDSNIPPNSFASVKASTSDSEVQTIDTGKNGAANRESQTDHSYLQNLHIIDSVALSKRKQRVSASVEPNSDQTPEDLPQKAASMGLKGKASTSVDLNSDQKLENLPQKGSWKELKTMASHSVNPNSVANTSQYTHMNFSIDGNLQDLQHREGSIGKVPQPEENGKFPFACSIFALQSPNNTESEQFEEGREVADNISLDSIENE